ncbi:hypothetical protein Pmani_004100 [Petrolisthes manimaculis]|uniref:PiggyBac transposable element-derived protein 4 C-terminal zinc-finger domain-containing protein n=1 Tax=Petrolisthes manimaculis TaxID=1843537 RepID=A0AAE1QEY8_9EUCA|nr:hypothetical protein Pmani_004100 [Petrolisthes manimaculis]
MEGRRMDTSNSSQPNPWGSTSSRGRQVQVSANGVYNQKRRLPSSPEHSSDEDEAHNLPTNTRSHQASSSCKNLMKRRQTTHVPPSAMATSQRKYNLTPTQFLPLLFTEDSEAEGVSGSDVSDLDDRGLQEESDLDYSCSDEEEIEGTEERHVSLQDSIAFDWSDGSDFVPVLHKFQNNRSGVTHEWPCNDEARESDYFRAFLDDEVMSFVAEKTNAYYRWVFRHMEFIPPKSRIRQKDIDPTKKPKLREFIYNVAYQILEEYGQPTTNIKGRRPNPLPDRIIEGYSRHYPMHTEMVNGQRQRKECYVCNHTTKRPKKRTRVNIICNECKIGLCVGDCFRDYHTLKNF